MQRSLGLSLAVALVLAPLAVVAADIPYSIFIDGRPVDASTPSGLSHRGVVFVNVVRAVKTFDGLLTFGRGGLVRVTIGGRTIDYRVGNRVAMSAGRPVRLSGAPFVENGDTYVPLASVAALAMAKSTVDTKHHRYMLSLPVPPPPTPTPVPTSASDDVMPSVAQAVAVATTGRSDASGLHARADVTNRTGVPYALAFPTADRVQFLVARNGSEVWSSTGPASVAPQPGTVVIPAHGTESYSATWDGYASAAPGRYTLRVRLLTTVPLDESPISLGVVTPSP